MASSLFNSETGAAASAKRFWWWKHRRAVQNGKNRWASMTQEEKDTLRAKADYAAKVRNERRKRLNAQLAKKTHFKVAPLASDAEMDDVENFFYGDVI